MKRSYKKIWRILLDRNLTITQLRQKSGVTTNAIQKLRKDESVPLETLEKICDALNCSLDDILEYVQEDKSENETKDGGASLVGELNDRDRRYYVELVNELIKAPSESEWIEFKVNNEKPELIGEYLSSISNSAALHERERGYLIFGVTDDAHEICGTNFRPRQTKVGAEELENWLLTQLNPRIDFKFVELETDRGRVVVVEIPAAKVQPTTFRGVEYVRVGSYQKKLKELPEKERKLWRVFEIRPYETLVAKENVGADDVTRLLDTGAFYTLLERPIPSVREGIMHDFEEYGFIRKMDNGNYAITNMGALLFAKSFERFDYLASKAIRVVRYRGSARTHAIRDQFFTKGYAVAFDEIVSYIMSMLPQEEVIETARREEFIMFPEKAVREIIGNLVVHQDLTARGQLMVEIFDERIEASNPGRLLVDVDRVIDAAPRARNEKMATFLRLAHICEIRGSGFDRIEEGMQDWKIPAPKVETSEDFCRTILRWRQNFTQWTKEEKIRTCYLYTCYCHVNDKEATNAALRKRFNVSDSNKSSVSRVIKETINAGKIKIVDPNAALKLRKYAPYWA